MSWMEEVITALAEPSLSLEKLSLTDENDASSTREIDFFGGRAPRLTDLTLNGVSIRWDSEVLHDLTVLDLSWIHFPSTHTILNVLCHSPRLQTVSIYRCTTKSTVNPSPLSIQLTHLTALQVDLGRMDAIEDFLGHLNAPGRCSLAISLPANGKVGDFLHGKLFNWMSNWRCSSLVPVEGALFEIDGGDFRVELSTTDRSEPLALSIESFGGSWVGKLRLLLPNLMDALASWIKDVTTLRLRLGYPPSGCRDFSFQHFIIKQVSRLPPVTSLELSGVKTDSLLDGLGLGDVSSLFRNVRTLSFLKMGGYELREGLNWMYETVQIVRDAIKTSSDEPNPNGQALKLGLRVPNIVISNNAKSFEAEVAVKELEKLVGSGNVLVVQND